MLVTELMQHTVSNTQRSGSHPLTYDDLLLRAVRSDDSPKRSQSIDIPKISSKHSKGIKRAIHKKAGHNNKLADQHTKLAGHNNKLADQDINDKLYPWQAYVIDQLKKDPHSYNIDWYYDPIGGSGKTYLAQYLKAQGDCCYLPNCDMSDVDAIYDDERVVIFDFVRSDERDVNYEAIIRMKDGVLLSREPHPHMRHFAIPHVMCFANFMPSRSLTAGCRWKIAELSGLEETSDLSGSF